MNSPESADKLTPQRVAHVIWRRKLVCTVVAIVVLFAGAGFLLIRPKTYQATSSVALLPVSTNASALPNYPNMITSLIPTYIQLISSPVLLNRVAATLPFTISEGQLANQVHAESLSNAAVINIVAQSPNAVQAQQIASRTTAVFLTNLRGNGVVVPQIYAQPTVPSRPASPGTKLKLSAILVLAVILGLGAGLLWDRLAGRGDGAEQLVETTRPLVLGVIPRMADQQDVTTILPARYTAPRRWQSLRTNFMYATTAHQVRSVTITSLHPGEGKTTVAVNLAVSLAGLGLSVVLVDAAIGDPALQEVFGLDNERGLTSTALNGADPASLLNAVPSIAGLQVVTSGPQSSPSGEASLYLQQLSRFCSLGDLVIVDSPALERDASAGLTAGVTDAVILVVRAGPNAPDQVGAGLRVLHKYNTAVLGTVLTMADEAVNSDMQSREPGSYPMSQAAPPAAQP